MEWLENLPLQRRVTAIILVICGSVLLLACGGLAAYELFDFRRAMVRDAAVMADIMATNCRAALSFDDENGARAVLEAMHSEPHVVAAAVYGPTGKLFAQYIRPGESLRLPTAPGELGARYRDGALVTLRPVLHNQKRIGTVFLESDLEEIHTRLALFGSIAAGVLLIAILIALPLSSRLQRPITEPILALAHTAREVAEKRDYSVRTPMVGRGEVALLTQAFNHMLAGIEERAVVVRKTHAALTAEVAERKRAEEALATSERHYRLIFEHSPVPMWIYDVATLRFLTVNEAAERHYGYTRDEFLGMTIRDIQSPPHLPDVDKPAATEQGGGEWRHRTKDGRTITVIVHAHDVDVGDIHGRLVVAQDITDRKIAEARVQSQLARLAQLHQITRAVGERQDVESIFQAVVRSLEEEMPADFTCVCLYDAAGEHLTVSGVGVKSRAVADRLMLPERTPIPIDRNGLSRCVRGQLVYERDVSAIAMPFPQKLAAGGLRAVVMAPLLVESKVFGVLLAAREAPDSFTSGDCEFIRQLSEHVALAAHQAQLYTALQHAYDDLRQTQQAILQQERLRALGQMASGIAHDINNAISPVSLYIESILENDHGLAPQSREWLTVVSHAVDDVSHTVARLREFYRQREPQLALSSLKLNPVISEVAELTRARWWDMPQQRGFVIELRQELEPDIPTVMGVASEVREALINLVFNAVDAMPNGGTLTLRTRKISRRRQGVAMPFVVVEVSDSGVGMDEATQRRCLEPFFTTKGERGTGLGLAMVYGIVRRHGADLEIDSAVGRGTTIRLVFPAAAPDAKIIEQSAGGIRPATRLRILIVDDDPVLLRSLRETLEADGHSVAAANGGQAGINEFQAALAKNEPFSCVITDLGMPYVDGRRVAAAIKGMAPEVRIVMLTGWGQRLVEEGDIPPHVDQVLSKPPKLRELREALANASPLGGSSTLPP
jgi:PAS domain S-box-containing protein